MPAHAETVKEGAHVQVAVVGANLMAGAAAVTRARRLAEQGVDAGPEAFHWTPRPLATRPVAARTKEPHVRAD